MTRSVRPAWLAILVLGCATAPPEPLEPLDPSGNADTDVEERRVIPLAKPLTRVAVSLGDPARGRFSLAEATRGVDGEGELSAELHTGTATRKSVPGCVRQYKKDSAHVAIRAGFSEPTFTR